ncbi:AAA family ATPase [Pedobacter sp. GR22-6]|uniref:AAA family ATPase n=1 Tax=Pedobacter sp. GR22-6 TaxID=3127957 RepID=UPI00307D70EF
MKLKNVRIQKLHGYISHDFTLDDDLILLVGINGSGKTSVLNAINWLLRLDIGRLASECFELIELKFEARKFEYVLSATQTSKLLELKLINITADKTFPPLTAKLEISTKSMLNNPEKKYEQYISSRNLKPDEEELPTWNFIRKNLPRPIVIGLDRTLYTDQQKGISFDETIRIKLRPEKSIHSETPIDIVSELLIQQFSRRNNKLLELNRKLNETIVLAAFDDVYSNAQILSLINQPPPTIKQLEKLHNQILDFLRDNNRVLDSDSSLVEDNFSYLTDSRIDNYFGKLKDLLKLREKKDDDLTYIVNIAQFAKIDTLVNAFSEFEIKTRSETEPLDEFLYVVNEFFIDSAKRIYFDKKTNRLKYNVIDKSNNLILEDQDIVSLSSGERQILILLTYVRYKEEKIFLIDEPELSLHIKWQEFFLTAVKRLKRKDCQLIIATHSPEIIGNYRKNCRIFNPYK